MTYALLIYRSGLQPLPRAQDQAALAGHRGLQAEASARGALHAVARLDEPVTARTVRYRDGAHDIADGPYIEAKEWLVGFYLIDCASADEAAEEARKICTDSLHTIEVRPVSWRWRPA